MMHRFKRYGQNVVFKVTNHLRLLSGKTYPLFVSGKPKSKTLDFISTTNCTRIAEIGIYQGSTSRGFASYLAGRGELHLFDFEDRVTSVVAALRSEGHTNVVGHPNSYKTMDSYNWSLMRLLREGSKPIYDYVLIDGAHTWQIDALTFFLVDKLLKVDGYIDFDDYGWNLGASPSLNPTVFPPTKTMYTDEQIQLAHVQLIVDLLVKPNPRYVEVVQNKIYKKIRSDE